jgi:4-alpha-glucanotransferase
LTRHAGVNVPLFSLRSSASWGIGELADLAPFTRWMADARLDRLLLLPLGTMQHGQTSPYAATSTLGIDPLYIAIEQVPEFARCGGRGCLSAAAVDALDEARRAPAIRYDLVRLVKHEALGRAFERFVADEWEPRSSRAHDLAAYIARERWWLDDYALFLALSRQRGHAFWREWPPALRDRDPVALDDARHEHARQMLFHQYCQWIAEGQWQEARASARALGVGMVGDLPFVAAADSPEVWSRAGEFMLDVSTGVPPDAFSATGQDWGLPTYNWPLIAEGDYGWLRQRSARMAALYDGLRVDHTIGLFRTYGRPREGEPFFVPADEPAQIAQGRNILSLLRETGLDLIAEDLGVVPDFLRAVLAELGVPGCKVLRWEREWDQPGSPFIDPERFEPRSAAMTGTHDTEPLSVWWSNGERDDRAALLVLPRLSARGLSDPDRAWDAALRDALIELAYHSGSDHLFLPMQDLFGWPDRINVPGTVGDHNWTWALPWPVDRMAEVADARERAAFLHDLAEAADRGAAR